MPSIIDQNLRLDQQKSLKSYDNQENSLRLFLAISLVNQVFSALEILATRFWLLLAFVLFFVIKDKLYLQIDGYILGETLLVSFASLIILIYCSQKSIEKIGPELHAVLIGLTPLTTFILENPFISHSINDLGYLSIVLAFAIGLRYFLKK